jgi:hypothetical protein
MELKHNPATARKPDIAERKRVPMSTPTRKLEVPEIPGFHSHWFLDRNVARALRGGYEYVDQDEVPANQFSVAGDSTLSGSADLGSRITMIGGTAEGGGVEHLVLMKIKEEYWQEDQKAIEQRNAAVIQGIFKNEQIMGSERTSAEDRNLRYVKTALFNRPARK